MRMPDRLNAPVVGVGELERVWHRLPRTWLRRIAFCVTFDSDGGDALIGH
jgi:hypothetical protein